MPVQKKEQQYTKPKLREQLKQRIIDADKGGRPGQWSARKAQLLAQEYERAGGGYKGPRTETQKSLTKGGDEKWATATGEKARKGSVTKRYLPQNAWSKLSEDKKQSTDRKKIEGSSKGRQYVANTRAASSARKAARKLSKSRPK